MISSRRAPTVFAYAYGVLVAAGLAHFLTGIPIQLSDSFGNMLKLDVPWADLLAAEFDQRAYLRPFLWAQLKAVHDLSGGDYFAWYRGVHAAQVLVLIVLFLQLVRPRTWADAAMVPLGLAVLIGLHTFGDTVREAFPINTYLTILLFCFSAALLALAPYRWWNDVLAVLLLAVAALTVESGLLVAVIILGAAMTGARGVSRAGLIAVGLTLAGYFLLRFLLLDVGAPALDERASGFGFSQLEPGEIVERFRDRPLVFYAYNVAASLVSVLLSEPRSGVFWLTFGTTLGAPQPGNIVNVAASLCATGAIAAFVWRRRQAWLSREFDRDDRLVLLFGMVLGANAVISYPYTKDVIMSPAGAFYAAACYVAMRHWIAAAAGPRSSVRALAPAAALCILFALTWSIRVVGIHANLRNRAQQVRNDWAYVGDWLALQNIDASTPRAARLLRELQQDALIGRPAPPPLTLPFRSVLDIY